MSPMIRKDDQRLASVMMVGLWMMGIAVLFGIAVVVNIYFFIIAIPLFVIGLGVAGYAVLRGLNVEKKGQTATAAYQVPDSLIIAKFATNAVGETLFSDFDILMDDPKTKFYVQIQPGQGRMMECKTNATVWQGCGEGMRGTAMLQGDWLGAFQPVIGSGQGRPNDR